MFETSSVENIWSFLKKKKKTKKRNINDEWERGQKNNFIFITPLYKLMVCFRVNSIHFWSHILGRNCSDREKQNHKCSFCSVFANTLSSAFILLLRVIWTPQSDPLLCERPFLDMVLSTSWNSLKIKHQLSCWYPYGHWTPSYCRIF